MTKIIPLTDSETAFEYFGRKESLWSKFDDWLAIWKMRHFAKHCWQRVVRGYSDSDTYNLDHQFCKWMLPRLKRFKKLASGYPSHLQPEEWDEIMDKMIRALETVLYDDDLVSLHLKGLFKEDKRACKKKWKEVDEGFELLGKYIRHLWW